MSRKRVTLETIRDIPWEVSMKNPTRWCLSHYQRRFEDFQVA